MKPSSRGDQVYTLLFDPDDRLWIGHATGLIVMARPRARGDDGRHDTDGAAGTGGTNGAGSANSKATSRPLLPPSALQPRPMPFDAPVALPSREGEVAWYRLDTRGFASGVAALTRTSEGHIWMGTTMGLIEFDGVRFRGYGTAEGLTDPVITSLAADADDNLWAATMAAGVMKVTRRGFRSYDGADGLGDPRASSRISTWTMRAACGPGRITTG